MLVVRSNVEIKLGFISDPINPLFFPNVGNLISIIFEKLDSFHCFYVLAFLMNLLILLLCMTSVHTITLLCYLLPWVIFYQKCCQKYQKIYHHRHCRNAQ